MSINKKCALQKRILELKQEIKLLKKNRKICCVFDCNETVYDDASYCKHHKCEICNNSKNDVSLYCDDCACKACRQRLISYNYNDYSQYCCGCGCKCGQYVKNCRCYS